MASLPPEMFNEDAVNLLRSYDTVDLLVGIPSYQNANTIGHVVRAVEAGLRKYFPNRRSLIVVSDGHSTDGTRQAALAATTEGDEEVLLLDPKAEAPDKLVFTYTGLSGKGSAFRAIFTVAESLGASACAVFDADLRSVSPEWVDRLIGPVLYHGYDLVAPTYERHKFDGTITNSIAFPLTAALYGHRLRQPIGGDFGFSGRLAGHRYADHWLSVDGIRPVRTFGFRSETSTEEIKVNPDRLLWRFVDGYVTHQDVWRQILGRDNFNEVREAIHRAGERPDGFRLPVELWARICYDYLIAYNAQVVDSDELTNSLIPLYFARTATFISESRTDSADEAEERIDSYAEVFRQTKSYLVRRFSESGRARRLADQRVSGDERRQGDDTSEFMAIRSP